VKCLDRKRVGRDARREVLEVGKLLPRQPGGSKMVIGRGRELVGPRGPASIESENAAVDRCRGLARQLLVDDRPTHRIEVRPFGSWRQTKRPDAANDGGERRIRGREVCDRTAGPARQRWRRRQGSVEDEKRRSTKTVGPARGSPTA